MSNRTDAGDVVAQARAATGLSDEHLFRAAYQFVHSRPVDNLTVFRELAKYQETQSVPYFVQQLHATLGGLSFEEIRNSFSVPSLV